EIMDRRKAERPLTKFPASNDLGLQFILFAEENSFSYADFPARTHQCLPFQGRNLSCKQDLYPAVEKISRRRILFAHGLGAQTGPAAKESRRKNPAVVQDQEIVRAQEAGKVNELTVFKCAVRQAQVEHARGAALRERLLGNEFSGQKKIEFGN